MCNSCTDAIPTKKHGREPNQAASHRVQAKEKDGIVSVTTKRTLKNITLMQAVFSGQSRATGPQIEIFTTRFEGLGFYPDQNPRRAFSSCRYDAPAVLPFFPFHH